MADLTAQIEAAAAEPSAATVDGRSVTNQPIAGLIAADRYLKNATAMTGKNRGITFTKLILPGHVDSNQAYPPG